MPTLDKEYWEARYQLEETGWDTGDATAPFRHYIDQLEDKNQHILIPGCGNAHEATYLFHYGFTNITLLDIATPPLEAFHSRHPEAVDSGSIRLVNDDFFKHNGVYDRILEQTFFCALNPKMRAAYAKQMHHLLKHGGVLAGLLFTFPLSEAGPPFGGSLEEYQQLFSPYFEIHTLEEAHNSIKPRAGREAFFIFEKR